MASITTWHRLVPISRSSDFETALAAELRDPLWLLARQRQVGEMRGEDTGSPAFVRIGYKSAALNDLVLSPAQGPSTTLPIDATRPLEAQILAEPHAPDLATRVELGLTFSRILEQALGAAAPAIRQAFAATPELLVSALSGTDFDPLDEASAAFAAMTAGRALDGVALHANALQTPPLIPALVLQALNGDPTLSAALLDAYSGFVRWVAAAFGEIGSGQPKGWNAQRLDYDVKLRFGENNAVTLSVHPNESGSLDWSSFDVLETNGNAFPATLETQVVREIPTHVRFPGMPAPRYWDFESGDLPWPELDTTRTELARLLVVDFAMLYGVDWFVVPLELDVARATKIESVVVYDVFGGRSLIERVEELVPKDRFTLYGPTRTGTPGGVGDFMLLPPAAGSALQHGPSLEEVRFARDEMANMAWGIEAITESRIGEPRRGTERDAAVDALTPPASPGPSEAALRYQLESKVPVHWVPLLRAFGGVSTSLEKGVTLRPTATGLQPVPAAGKILNPPGAAPYLIFDEEVPKGGVRVERVVYASRSHDGKSHLWVARRKRAGSGETQSGLRFDAALTTER